MKRNRVLVAGAAVVLVALAIAGILQHGATNPVKSGEPAIKAPKIAKVIITSQGFEPSTLEIKKGTKVVWTNTDQNAHRVAANPYPSRGDLKELYSRVLNEKQSYSYKFNKAGTYNYHDDINPAINAQVVVKE